MLLLVKKGLIDIKKDVEIKSDISRRVRLLSSLDLGLILMFSGGVWLARSLDWIPDSVPIWSLVLILLGLLIIVNNISW